MFAQFALASLNHLLEQNSWAADRLVPFAGKTVRFEIAPISLACAIEDGRVSAAEASAIADASFTIAPSLLPRLAAKDEKAYAEIGQAGDPELLAAIMYLSHNLSWDAAEDLSRFTGDVAAERIVQTVEGVRRQLGSAIGNIAQAAAEYWVEEQPMVVKPAQVAEFKHHVASLARDIARLESRVQRLVNGK